MKKIVIKPYDVTWPAQFDSEKAQLSTVLGDQCIAIYHVGSTAVPSLSAKPRLDIIIVARQPELTIDPLVQAGFEYMGEFNIPFHYGFRRRIGQEVNLHVYEEGYPEIELNLKFRDLLINDPEVRAAYQDLKCRLAGEEEATQAGACGLSTYSIHKGDFIRDCLESIGFNRLRMLIVSNESERHYIQKCQLVYRQSVTADEHDVYVVFYEGAVLIGYAQLNKNAGVIAEFYLEPLFQASEDYFRNLATRWLDEKRV